MRGESILKSIKNVIISFIAIVMVFLGAYLFNHSTPERLIRSNLFFNGHFIGALTTEVYKGEIDSQYGQFYFCKNPRIGPYKYSFIKKNGLWYINWNGTGEG